ncbi:MAG: hypothetical protein ACRDM9_01800, partial [Gaiellaceae bacterium]
MNRSEWTTAPRLALERITGARRAGWISFAAFIVLVGASAFVRTRALDSTYWLDEGISIGFASHGLVDIPGALEQ